MRKTRTLLMMAFALLFSGAAFAASTAFTLTKGGFGEDPKADGQGIYQQYTVTFDADFVRQFAGKDKIVTLSYAETATPASGEEYDVKEQFISLEDKNNPVTSLNFVLDGLLPKTEYRITATVSVKGVDDWSNSDETFVSYLGDLAIPQPNGLIDLSLGKDNAKVTIKKNEVKTVSGKTVVLEGDGAAEFKVELSAGTNKKEVPWNADKKAYFFQDNATTPFLQQNTTYTATATITYNGKSTTISTNGLFGALELNPLWIYVEKVDGGYDVIIKGMSALAEGVSAIARIYTWIADEECPATQTVSKSNNLDTAEGENFHFTAAELKHYDADIFSNKKNEGFYFKIDVVTTPGGSDETVWVGKECNAVLTPPTWPYPFDFVPLWNNGHPTLSSPTLTAAKQAEVIETVNELIEQNYWDPQAQAAETHQTYYVTPGEVFAYQAYQLSAAPIVGDEVLYGSGRVDVAKIGENGWYQILVKSNSYEESAADTWVGKKFWINIPDLSILANGPIDQRFQLYAQKTETNEETGEVTELNEPGTALPVYVKLLDDNQYGWNVHTDDSGNIAAADYPQAIAYNLDGITANPEAAQEKYSVPTLEGAEASDAANTVSWNLSGYDKNSKLNGTVTVDWMYYLIYEKWVSRKYYPDVKEPNIYTQTLKDAVFADWAKLPADEKLAIKEVCVFVDADGTKKNTVNVELPRYFNGGDKIKNMYVKVYVKGQSQPVYLPWNTVNEITEGAEGSYKVEMPQDLANNPATWTKTIPIDVEDVIRNCYDTYYDVLVVIYGEDKDGNIYRTYKATDDNVFSAPNTKATAVVNEINQVVSITEKKLNIDPKFALGGFKSWYTITGKLYKIKTTTDEDGNVVPELDEDGNPVKLSADADAEATLVKDHFDADGDASNGEYNKTDGKYYRNNFITEQGLVFANVDEDTWYTAEFELQYYAIRDRLDNSTGDGTVPVDTVVMKKAFTSAEGVVPFKTVKIPADSEISIHHPRYYLQETEGDIIARIRVFTKNDDDNVFVVVDGMKDPIEQTGTEEVEVPAWIVDETIPFFGGYMGTETQTLKTFDVPLHVDLDVFTPYIPATWNLGYTVYIEDEATDQFIDTKYFDEESEYAINTPLPYVQFMFPAPAYFYADEVFTPFDEAMMGLELPRFGYTYPSRADFRAIVKEDNLAELMGLLIPNLSAWKAAKWAEENLHNTFAYTRAGVPAFENASDPKFFGAPNLVYCADIQDPAEELLYADQHGQFGVLYGNSGRGIKWWTDPGHHDDSWTPYYGVFEQHTSSQYYHYDEDGNIIPQYVTIMPLDEKLAAAVKQMLTWREYYEALDKSHALQSYDDLTIFGRPAYAFSVVLNDAKKGAPVEENYSYFNNVEFTALDALYTGVFPAKNRTVVLPFTGKAYVDADYATEATVRYFSAGYLDEDNKVVFRFSKKLRNGEASNELTAGQPYMVNAGESVSYADVYFHAENAEMLTSIDVWYYGNDGVEYYPSGISTASTGVYVGGYSTQAYMWGTYDLTYDFSYWNEEVEDDAYWKWLRGVAAAMLGKEELTEEEFFDNMPPILRPAYEQYKQYSLFRFSSLDNWFWELERTSIPQYDAETHDLLPGDYDFIKPFQCALYFRGSNNPNAGYSIGIRFDDDDATVIENSPMIETVNGDIFDVMGRKVSEPVKGEIYIQNGKKFIAK